VPEISLGGFTVLDFVLVLVLLGYLIAGLRNGFLVTLGGIAGFVAGAVAAFFAIPLVSEWVPQNPWRLIAVIGTVIILIVVGQGIGSALGASIRRWSDFPPLRFIDRILGGVVNVVVAALVLSMLAFSVGTLDSATPAPVRSWMAQLRSIAVDDGIPTLLEGVGPAVPAQVPDASVDTPELAAAGASVVRITGTAFQCGQNQTGSGFVIAPGRVITNAHVVAGVNEPVVEVPGVGARQGRVVQLDTARDIAVIAVDDLSASPLQLGEELDNGSTAAFAGYPAGGPYRIQPASVQNLSPVLVNNIYGSDPQALEVYSLAANVQQGNSGGPLLDLQGRVTGVVFAKSTADAPVGYALSLEELRPIAQNAPALEEAVSAGQCTRG